MIRPLTLLALFATVLALAHDSTATPPHRATVPRGAGWFCFDDPLPTGGTTQTCDRPMEACMRQRAQRHAGGEVVGTCTAAPSAWCFTFRDNVERHGGRRHHCSRERAQCEAMGRQVAHSEPMYGDVSDCAEFR